MESWLDTRCGKWIYWGLLWILNVVFLGEAKEFRAVENMGYTCEVLRAFIFSKWVTVLSFPADWSTFVISLGILLLMILSKGYLRVTETGEEALAQLNSSPLDVAWKAGTDPMV